MLWEAKEYQSIYIYIRYHWYSLVHASLNAPVLSIGRFQARQRLRPEFSLERKRHLQRPEWHSMSHVHASAAAATLKCVSSARNPPSASAFAHTRAGSNVYIMALGSCSSLSPRNVMQIIINMMPVWCDRMRLQTIIVDGWCRRRQKSDVLASMVSSAGMQMRTQRQPP